MKLTTTVQNALLVDDDDADQYLAKLVIERSGLVEKLHTFHYADDALEFLGRKDHPHVELIFLDVNMPRLSGLQFLQRATALLGTAISTCAVVMLTSSMNPADQQAAEKFPCVRAFINKPLERADINRVAEILHSIER